MADPRMKDADKTLAERIELAVDRVTKGQGQMRIPVEATDPDVVLVDCKERIAALEADCARLREDAERYRWLKDRADSVDFEYGPDKKFVMLFAMPHGMRVSGDLDKTIDAARREKT